MNARKLLTAVTSAVLAVFILSFSIAVPILCRPFYYAHIAPLRLEERTGLTRAEIKDAYNEMLDYCLGRSNRFGTGVLKWSESGKSHFTDVRGLFLLDIRVLAVSAVLLILLLLLGRKYPSAPILGRRAGFWGSTGLAAVFLIIGGLAATDFDRAFVVFHSLFFPGKDNWIFDPWEDQIITILPEEFFRNCAILILGVLILLCAVLILFDLLRKENKR